MASSILTIALYVSGKNCPDSVGWLAYWRW